MATFEPYQIFHLQLNEIDNFSASYNRAYIVFWMENVPLGHLWIDEKTSKKEKLLDCAQVLKAIQPAAEYYISRFLPSGSLQQNFEPLDFATINASLQEAIACYLASMKTENLRLSVVICTRNRAPYIQNCIENLLNGTDPDFELIIVDNAPDDDKTELIVKKYPAVRYVCEKRKGLDIARNTGAKMATGDIIAYTDDDVLVDKDWTSKLKACFKDSTVMAVTGMVIPFELNTRVQYRFERYWGFNKGYVPILFDQNYFSSHLKDGVPAWDVGAGANMAFRKEIFELAGWFDERLDVGASGCSGDSEYWYRIMAEGWSCFYVPYLFVFHQHRKTDKELEHQLFYYMRGHVSALLVQYEKYGHEGNLKRIRKTLPRYYLDRLKHCVKKLQLKEIKSLINQIKGCYSGYQFYQQHKK